MNPAEQRLAAAAELRQDARAVNAAAPDRRCLCRHAEASHDLTPAGVRTACTVSTGPKLARCPCTWFHAALPIWLLDVDGVVSAVPYETAAGKYRKPPTHVWPADRWQRLPVRADGIDYTITAATPVLDLIRAVHAQGLAEIRWHTTWKEWAVLTLGPALDLPAFPLQDPGPDGFLDGGPAREEDGGAGWTMSGVWWKLAGAELAACEDRPVLWTDDELDLHRTGVACSVGQQPDRLLIAPNEHTGLTPRHVALIGGYLGVTGV